MKFIILLFIVTNIFGQGDNGIVIIDKNDDVLTRDFSNFAINKFNKSGNHLSFEILGIYYDKRQKFEANRFLNFDIKDELKASVEYVFNHGEYFPAERLRLIIVSKNFGNGKHRGIASFDLMEFCNYENFSFYDIKIIDLNHVYLFTYEKEVLNVYKLTLEYNPNIITDYKKVYSIEMENLSYFNVVNFNVTEGKLSFISNSCLYEIEEEAYTETPLEKNLIYIDDRSNGEKYFIPIDEWTSFKEGNLSFKSMTKKSLYIH